MRQSVKGKVVQSLTCQTPAKQKCLLTKQEITQNADKIFLQQRCAFLGHILNVLKYKYKIVIRSIGHQTRLY